MTRGKGGVYIAEATGAASLSFKISVVGLTDAFSKKVENHVCSVALHAMYYNFVRIHQTLKGTPAMAGE